MENFFTIRRAPFLLVVIAFILSKFDLVYVSNSDYLFIFAIGAIYAAHHDSILEIRANRIMNLVLYYTLVRKGVIERGDLFIAQNNLLGDTSAAEGNKLRKELREANIYLHEYLTDDEVRDHMEEIKQTDHSIFKSFAGLVETYKENYVANIVLDKAKTSDAEKQHK